MEHLLIILFVSFAKTTKITQRYNETDYNSIPSYTVSLKTDNKSLV